MLVDLVQVVWVFDGLPLEEYASPFILTPFKRGKIKAEDYHLKSPGTIAMTNR